MSWKMAKLLTAQRRSPDTSSVRLSRSFTSAFLPFFLLAAQDTDGTREGLIGLLTLPQVFGGGPCVPFEPSRIPLYTQPRAQQAIAHIQVDRYWTMHQNGGCSSLEVRVHEPGRPAVELPTEEHAYEEPAAIVVAHDGEWFQIRTLNRALWMKATAENTYRSLVQLLIPDSLAYLTRSWDQSLHNRPGGPRATVPVLAPQAPVEVRDSRIFSGELWLLIETTDGCSQVKTPKVLGWVRAYGRDNAPAVWFYSRGC